MFHFQRVGRPTTDGLLLVVFHDIQVLLVMLTASIGCCKLFETIDCFVMSQVDSSDVPLSRDYCGDVSLVDDVFLAAVVREIIGTTVICTSFRCLSRNLRLAR